MMSYSELFLIGIGLSMDAFAAALCKGLCLRKVTVKQAALVALFFGGFQALMPFLGWALGSQLEQYITSLDHWIALILLGFIGGKMIYGDKKKNQEEVSCDVGLNLKELTVMAIATSIDALIVGITFATLKTNIVPAISIIGVTTFVLSFAGVYVGKTFGVKYKQRAEVIGGVILVIMGLKIFIEHMVG